MRQRPVAPLGYSRAFKTSLELFKAQDEGDERRIRQLDDALTPPDKANEIARRRMARARKRRLMKGLRRYVWLFGPPKNIGVFVAKIEARGWMKIASPGPADYPGPSKPHDLSGQTVRNMLHEIGVIGTCGRKVKK